MDSGSQIDIWFKNKIILIEFGDIMQGFVQNIKDPNPSLFLWTKVPVHRVLLTKMALKFNSDFFKFDNSHP